jgi:hypothetical protein
MKATTIVNKCGLLAGAAALVTAGALAFPASGHAKPGDCLKWAWPAQFNILIDNGTVLAANGADLSTTGPLTMTKVADAASTMLQPGIQLQGTLRLEGTHIPVATFSTSGGSGKALALSGRVDKDGKARGDLFQEPDRWETDRPLACTFTEPQPAAAPPQQSQPQPQEQPQEQPAEEAKPLQGPLVTPKPGFAGVTFTVTDRSGVASQCTYSSEGFEKSFALPAKGTVDVFVPAVPLRQERTGTVTCDNGTSTPTSVFF